MLTPEELEQNLSQFYGTEAYHRLSFSPIVCTDGVLYFANNAEAYWLITDITAIVPTLDTYFCYIVITSKGGKAIISYEDGNDNVLHKHKYDFTDLPEGEWKFYCTDNVLMLPSEY